MKRFAVLLILAGCHPVNLPPAPDGFVDVPTSATAYDAGDADGLGTSLGNACKRLRELGCSEGFPLRGGQTCYEHLIAMSTIVGVPSDCVAAAADSNAVQACGNSGTLRFRCITK